MIKNDKQLIVSKDQIKKFEEAIGELEKSKETMAEIMFNIQYKALYGQLESLKNEVREYETLKKGNLFISNSFSLAEIGQILIKARIALDLTQAQLAERVGTTQQQIQRYESSDYESASISTIVTICDALQISLKFEKIFFFRQSFDLPDGMSQEMVFEEQNRVKTKGHLFFF